MKTMQLPTHLTFADAFPQFIVSKIVKEADGLIYKYPCNPRGKKSSHKDPANWMTLTKAIATIEALKKSDPNTQWRLGFSITAETKLFLLDIDKAYKTDPDGNNGAWSPFSTELFSRALGCFTEISQSGTGLHVMARYQGEAPPHANKNSELGIELYTHDRFVMFGEKCPAGDWNFDATPFFHQIAAAYFPKHLDNEQPKPVEEIVEEEDESTLSDEQVIARARAKPAPRAAFGDGASFTDLYEANEEVLARAYPSPSEGKLYNASAADLALANMLAFQTGDREQILRIMWTSQLVREKWSTHRTYLLDTVNKALSSRSTIHSPASKSKGLSTESQDLLADVPQEFDGCYFVKSEREIYTLQHGLVNQEGFNICFFAHHFTGSPYAAFKKVAKLAGRIIDHQGFRPDLPHGEITEREGETFVNTYKPITIRMQKGDISPLQRLLDINYPDPRDQRIFMSFAATMVQKPGVKSQWAVVLQGVQGCGKTLLVDIIANAVGLRYTHKAKADEFENRFNSQWFGKTFIAIEDPEMKEAKLEEVIKPLITQNRISFEGKGKNARMGDFPANFIITLNDFENLRKRKEARRLAVFMSAMQTPEDKIKMGATDAFYSWFAKWLQTGGQEICNYHLHHYRVDPEFDFAGVCVTAPHTSTTDAAIEESRDEIFAIILEEIELGRIGFKNGFMSSAALTNFLTSRRVRHLLPDSKRGQLLKELGYEHHPGLRKGQAVRVVKPDNCRPRIFIKIGHPAAALTDREAIMRAYEEAQEAE
jgi:primase-polymerase (primpol)-like protein